MKPMIRIHNLETDEITDREMTDAEFSKWQSDNEKLKLEKEEQLKAASAKAALLEKLGITEDEAKLLLS
jgi:hypothetical protein